jgi:hypothetical protein
MANPFLKRLACYRVIAKLVVTTMKLLLPIRAEGKDRVAAADGVLPGMPQCSGGRRQAGSKDCRHDCHNLLTSAPSDWAALSDPESDLVTMTAGTEVEALPATKSPGTYQDFAFRGQAMEFSFCS